MMYNNTDAKKIFNMPKTHNSLIKLTKNDISSNNVTRKNFSGLLA